jgi:hypothetical protein
VPVPEGFSFVGDFSCLGLTVKTDISIALSGFLIKLDLTQAARFGLVLKALGMGAIELPDWLADSGFSRVLLVSYSLLGNDRVPEGLHIQGGMNVFGLEGYIDFGASGYCILFCEDCVQSCHLYILSCPA